MDFTLILQGTHPEFVQRLHQIEDERILCIENAKLWQDYQLSCAERLYHLETEQVEQDYISEKEGLRDKMLLQIEHRRRKLKEDRENLTIDGGSPQQHS